MLALRNLMKTSGVAALAAGLAFVALPSAAMADPGDHDRGGWQGRGGGGEQRGGGNGGGWGQRQQSAPAPVQQSQPAPQARGWGGGGQQGNPGWQARAAQGGHDWNNGGGANRPAPPWGGQARAQAPAGVPVQNGWQQRNPTYSDPNRTRDYGANRGGDRQANQGQPQTWQRNGTDGRNNDWRGNDRARPQQGWNGQGWNGQRWNGQNWDRNADNRGNWQRDRNGGWNGNRDSWQRDRNGGWNGGRNTNWNRDWRRDNRYNWSGWRNDHRDVFRMGRYNPPYRDWSYRRLSIGFYLDSGFYGSNYLIDDPYDYRLPPAYGPYRWVRYYDDALLVNIYDGEVADVIYDFFW